MNDNLINYQKYDPSYNLKVCRKDRFFKTQRLLFRDNTDKLIGFFDMKDKVYDFGSKCFKLKTTKFNLVNGFHFNFIIKFLDNNYYANMEGYLSNTKKRKYIKGFFVSDQKKNNIISKNLNYLPDDGVLSKKNQQFYLNGNKFFKIYKSKNKEYKIIFDEIINKNQIIFLIMVLSCLFIKS